MSCAPDPEPCERCGAPIMVVMDQGRPIGWGEYQCLCLAADHHFGYPCLPRVAHTPERCAAWRGRPNATAWQDMRHNCLRPERQRHPARDPFAPYPDPRRQGYFTPPPPRPQIPPQREYDLGELAREIEMKWETTEEKWPE